MAGWDNDCGYANNFDFSTAGAGSGSEANGLQTNGQLWIGRTAVNAGGTHIDVATLTPGSGIAITNGAGSITIAASPGSALVSKLTPDWNADGSAATSINPQSGNINVLSYNPSPTNTATNFVTGTLNSTGVSTGNLQIENRAWTTQFVVDPSTTIGERGTYSTMSAAMAAASAGDTVFLRGAITENFTIKANVNIVGWPVSGSNSSPSITGKITMSTAGICTISGIKLITNSDYFLETSGAVSASVTLDKCNLQCTNNTGINQTATSGAIRIQNCQSDLGTTGIALFASTAGTLQINNCPVMSNSGGSTTASTKSAGTLFIQGSALTHPITTSGTAAIQIQQCYLAVTDTTCLTHGGSGTVSFIIHSKVDSGTASAISVGASGVLYCDYNDISSSNTNAITGAGSILYGTLTFSSSSHTINTTTRTGLYTDLGKYKCPLQPRFSAYLATSDSNVTGDGTKAYIGGGNALTELFDIGSNFNTNGTFTAPITGYYHFCYGLLTAQATAGMTAVITLEIAGTSALNYTFGNYGALNAGNFPIGDSRIVFMTAGDTARVSFNFGGGALVVDLYGGASDPRTYFSGTLIG